MKNHWLDNKEYELNDVLEVKEHIDLGDGVVIPYLGIIKQDIDLCTWYDGKKIKMKHQTEADGELYDLFFRLGQKNAQGFESLNPGWLRRGMRSVGLEDWPDDPKSYIETVKKLLEDK